jgi:hypothetical protein
MAAVVALLAGCGGSHRQPVPRPAPSVQASAAPARPKPAEVPAVSIPAARQTDLARAAAAAHCTVKNARVEGNAHSDKDFKESDYKTNPPTSGDHNPIWYEDGIYAPGTVPRLGMLVHPLEHGRIEIQYRPGTAQETVARLAALTRSIGGGRHMLMFQNTTKMPFRVAATAWGHYLGCATMNDRVFDAIRDFHTKYVDRGPEVIP